VQDVSGKLFSISNIFGVIEKNEMVSSVMVEDALQLVGSALDILLPLRFKELEALGAHDLRVLLLKVLDCSHTFVERRIGDFARDGDLDGLLVLNRRSGIHLLI
jgi:hypothetical protein